MLMIEKSFAEEGLAETEHEKQLLRSQWVYVAVKKKVTQLSIRHGDKAGLHQIWCKMSFGDFPFQCLANGLQIGSRLARSNAILIIREKRRLLVDRERAIE